jgi:hypothetical protein
MLATRFSFFNFENDFEILKKWENKLSKEKYWLATNIMWSGFVFTTHKKLQVMSTL